MEKSLLFVLTIACVAIVAVGCASKDPPTGMPNPASVYCKDHGGTLSLVEEAGGQKGLCTLKDGTICEEWAYYRGECQAPLLCEFCPEFVSPGPDFCRDGKIVSGGFDACNCSRPPKCERVACTMDARICPDGSAVGRIAPDCEFAKCPGEI